MSRLWIRTDASATIGLGHFMRMMALAEAAVAAGISPRYVMAQDPVVRRLPRIDELAMTLLPAPEDRGWLTQVEAQDLVVFDGYHFVAEDFAAARGTGARVAALDDFGRGTFDVDVLLNPAPGPAPEYDVDRQTTLLMGPQYALVREEFRTVRRRRADGPDHLVLTFGGSDPAGVLSRVLPAIDADRVFRRVTAVVGPAAQTDPGLVASRPWLQLCAPTSIAATFDSASAVVSAAGTTTWELLCMGLPTAVVEVADNQRHVGPAVSAAGAALFLGPAGGVQDGLVTSLRRLADTSEQSRLSTNALRLVDGAGAARVVAALRHP